ncbi:MAG: hypothetical protein ACSHYB_11740 [Roseibacillus sp.]
MAEENHRGRKKPQLKVVDENDSVHRLGGEAQKTPAPRKKANLRRTHEANAIARDLDGGESPSLLSKENSPPEADAESTASSQPAAPLRIPPVIFFLAVAAFLLLLAAGVFLALGGRDRNSLHSMQDRSRANLQSTLQEKEEARDIVEALTEALESYTSASTIEEKLVFVRQPERVEPLMRDHYKDQPLIPKEGAKLISQYALPIESSSFVILTSSFPDSSNKIFLAEADTDLNITIDWESDACYQPVDIDDYVAEKPSHSVDLRVFAKPDNFYVYEFSDSSKYQCIKLTFRDNDEFLFGYIERDSPSGLRMANHFRIVQRSGSGMPEPLFLRVKFPKNAKGERGVLIEELLAVRWANIEESKINE